MKSLTRNLVLLAIVAVALLVSNPDLTKHQEKIIEKYKQENPITGALGAGDLIKQIVAYKSYYLFSVGKISITDEQVSFGIAGFVVVHGNLDINKYKDKLPDLDALKNL
jgi:hypothetical protein